VGFSSAAVSDTLDIFHHILVPLSFDMELPRRPPVVKICYRGVKNLDRSVTNGEKKKHNQDDHYEAQPRLG